MQKAFFVLWTVLFVGACTPGRDLPAQLPDVTSWEVETSGGLREVRILKLANATIQYSLHSSYTHPSMYVVSHYRVQPTAQTGIFEYMRRPYAGEETVYWLQPHPGGRGFLRRVFIKRAEPVWWTAGLLKRNRWQEMMPGSADWTWGWGVASRVWAVHVFVYVYGKDPASLTF